MCVCAPLFLCNEDVLGPNGVNVLFANLYFNARSMSIIFVGLFTNCCNTKVNNINVDVQWSST